MDGGTTRLSVCGGSPKFWTTWAFPRRMLPVTSGGLRSRFIGGTLALDIVATYASVQTPTGIGELVTPTGAINARIPMLFFRVMRASGNSLLGAQKHSSYWHNRQRHGREFHCWISMERFFFGSTISPGLAKRGYLMHRMYSFATNV